MTSSLYISTTGAKVGKALVALGILDVAQRRTPRIGFFRPIAEGDPGQARDEDIDLILGHFGLPQSYEASYGLSAAAAIALLAEHKPDEIIERIIAKYKALEDGCDFVLIEGTDFLIETTSAFEFNFNREIARNLACPVLVVGSAEGRSVEEALGAVGIAIDSHRFRGCEIFGAVVTKVDPAIVADLESGLRERYGQANWVLGVVPFDRTLGSPRVAEVAEQLEAEVLYGHQRLDALVYDYLVAAMQSQHAIEWLHENHLVITPGDRADVILSMLQADQSANYPQLSGLVLSTGFRPEPSVSRLLDGLPDPLPILSVKTDTYVTAMHLQTVRARLRPGDTQKIRRSIELFDRSVDLDRLVSALKAVRPQGLTPKMFTYQLLQKARSDQRHIVLPEGDEPRMLEAAAHLLAKKAVALTLLGPRDKIAQAIKKHRIALDVEQLNIIDPATSGRIDEYAQTFYELRKHKGVTPELARDCVMDVSYFGTMMVYKGEADGMVSGAVHTTQHTVRPALQLIKTKPGYSIVSSVFLMCLEDGVLVYGDCAVNPDPDAEQLAEIAIVSAETALAFGIEPKVALLSYSSGSSGVGADVEKVRTATAIARRRRPDLQLEGPIQYDAAVDRAVAAQKMPGSEVAGQATVL
ncbi:MAG: phosphate acetyltransferase, partial [Gammaproteobacteria bacterium]|nr:phosphate acetyltransferase [Gammaproteobacteria bacterium]